MVSADGRIGESPGLWGSTGPESPMLVFARGGCLRCGIGQHADPHGPLGGRGRRRRLRPTVVLTSSISVS